MIWALAAAAGAAMLAAIIWIARREGRASAERDVAEGSIDRARKANAIDEDVARVDDADLDRELRDPAGK